MDTTWHIYAMQHKATGRIYVGRTSKSIEERVGHHLQLLGQGKHHNELMQADYDEYGKEYEFYRLETTTEYPKSAEYKWMDKLKTYDKVNGYNYNDPHYAQRKVEKPCNIIDGAPTPNKP